jgi:1,2-diacylglycerol 3-beta-glucosyltransferase
LTKDLAKITVWVAARNEAKNIIACLAALQNQDYPKSHLQILVGNDHSTDATAALVAAYIKDKPNFQLININQNINQQKGKANVLANLYAHSTGNYFLITDADVIVPPRWCTTMLSYFNSKPQIGHLVGISSISTPTLFGFLQALDWLWALTLLKLASLFGIALTGLGNNSAISRAAYQRVGGYAKIPFSITEDFALFHAVVASGFGFHNAFNSKVFAKTTAMPTIMEFLQQRKRWMVGALQCPWWVQIFLYFQALFPLLLLLIFTLYSGSLAFTLLAIKYLAQILLILPTIFWLKEYRLLPALLLYEFYSWIWGLAMLVFYYLPIQINWKDRLYNTHD